MFVFSVLMIFAATMMIRQNDKEKKQKTFFLKNNPTLMIGEGIIVGFVTGFVGAGGGFLIVPTLILLAGLKIKIAIGTSLMIIAFKSIIGFGGDLLGLPNKLDISYLFYDCNFIRCFFW